MKTSDKLSGISRRDLLKLTGTYGISSTLLAAGAFTGAMSAANLAKAAESTYEKRFSKEPKFQLKFGAAGFNPLNLLIERAGALEFARDLEARTDGEIRVDSLLIAKLNSHEFQPSYSTFSHDKGVQFLTIFKLKPKEQRKHKHLH